MLLRISLRVFAVSVLREYCHADWLGRCAFGCGIHTAPTFARAVCSKPHSQGQVAAFPWVLSYLSSDLLSTFHTAVPTSAYPGHCPRLLLLRQSFHRGHWLEPTCFIDLLQESSCGYSVPLFCFAPPYLVRLLSTVCLWMGVVAEHLQPPVSTDLRSLSVLCTLPFWSSLLSCVGL